MKDRVSTWLILVLLIGLPTLAYVSEAEHVFAGVFKVIGVAFKLIFWLIVAIGVIIMLIKEK